jgi:hypothetical protein
MPNAHQPETTTNEKTTWATPNPSHSKYKNNHHAKNRREHQEFDG